MKIKRSNVGAKIAEHQELPTWEWELKTLGNETRARMSRYTAYLPLQHQLFGEQHGLVTEGFSHLHPSRHIPGTAWTFNT